MSDEEASALNRKLGIKALKQFGSFMLLKWILIFGATYLAKKWFDSLEK